MHAHFKYRLTKDEYIVGLTALMDQLGRQDSSRTPRVLEQLTLFVVVFAVLAIFFPEALPGLLIATLLVAVLQGALRGRWVRGATGQSYDPAVADQDVEFTDVGMIAHSSLRERRWTWAAVRRIHDLKSAIVVEFAGWDMIVLPDRLWTSMEERRAFVEDARVLAVDAPAAESTVKPASFDTRDLLTVGALAAGVDVLALIVFAMPVHAGPGRAVSDGAFLGTFAAVLLLGLLLAYVAFRVARNALARLYDGSPRFAIGITQALVWAVPLYMLTVYLGWI